MSRICPICNGFESIHISCKRCGSNVFDAGRYMDYFDNYSAYLDIDDTKMANGIENDFADSKCPHLLYCPHCSEQSIMLITEI